LFENLIMNGEEICKALKIKDYNLKKRYFFC